jgi:hypothetical protein
MNTIVKNVLILSARRCGSAVVLGLVAALLLALPCSGQTPGSGNNGSQMGRRTPPTRGIGGMDQTQIDTVATPVYYEKRLQMLNAAQHKSMVADTDRLVKLVTDLNSQINSSKSTTLTVEQMRMVAEIEKLAHNVRDKMRMSVRSAASNEVGPEPPFMPR